MNKLKNILLLPAFFFIISCGGGGGKYFEPSVSLNTYGITKDAFSNPDIGKEHRIEVYKYGDIDPSDTSDDREIGGEKYSYSRNISFNNNNYTVGIPVAKWVSIITQDDTIIKKLKTPRYTIDAVSVELTRPGYKPFLAILINQQATSRSSTLYILDSAFNPIYKEHLLGAKWISKIPSPDGDLLLVSCGDKWRPDGEWIFIGGNWQYNIFEYLIK